VLLERYLPSERIQQSIDAGLVEALNITCSGYTSASRVLFPGRPELVPWRRASRVGVPTTLPSIT